MNDSKKEMILQFEVESVMSKAFNELQSIADGKVGVEITEDEGDPMVELLACSIHNLSQKTAIRVSEFMNNSSPELQEQCVRNLCDIITDGVLRGFNQNELKPLRHTLN